jgi:hypothetical protein
MNKIIDKIKNLDIQDFVDIDLNNINFVSSNNNLRNDVNGMPGQEHYRLLCLISTWFDNTHIYELGTYKGGSALCLAYNKSNYVISYDIENLIEVERQKNIEFRFGDYRHDRQLLLSPLLFIDTVHDGVWEKDIYDYLTISNYKGITIWDDIKLNDEMKNFWNSVTKEKYDISQFGHWSGTGVIIF